MEKLICGLMTVVLALIIGAAAYNITHQRIGPICKPGFVFVARAYACIAGYVPDE